MLYAREAFEPLTDETWDAARVAAAVREIVADVERHYGGSRRLWPADEWDGWRAATPLKCLYVGAAGVVLALDILRRRELVETRLDLETLARDVLALERAEPDFMQGIELPDAARVVAPLGRDGRRARRLAAARDDRARRRRRASRPRERVERRRRPDVGHAGDARRRTRHAGVDG